MMGDIRRVTELDLCDQNDRLRKALDLAEATLRAVLLFYSTHWDEATRAEWERLTGAGVEATTKTLCDRVRMALKEIEASK